MMISVEQLPPRVREYMGSHFTTLKNIKLASRYRLSTDQLDGLASVLGDVFLKSVQPKDFADKLQAELKMEKSQAFLLAADAADQHLVAHGDYLGDMSNEIQQWRQWGRQLGGKQPGNQASPEVERMIAQAHTIRPGRGLEMSSRRQMAPTPVSKRPLPTRARSAEARPAGPTVGQRIAERRKQQVEPEQPQSSGGQGQTTPESRLRFLGQVRGLVIDSMRQGSESAEGRINQVAQKISQVLQGAPGERAVIGQALKQSPLFSLYQQMGQETIRSGQPIDVVIYQRYQQNQPFLLKEEFDAVAQLVKEVS
jgi:hypothetical protein